MSDEGEHTIRGVPLRRCTVEQLQRELTAAANYAAVHEITREQRARMGEIEKEILKRRRIDP